MAKLVGVREQRHWFLWDKMLDTTGASSIQKRSRLFQTAMDGVSWKTNLPAPGHLPNDDTFHVLAIGLLANFGNERLYGLVGAHLFMKFIKSDKVDFDYTPASMFMVRTDHVPDDEDPRDIMLIGALRDAMTRLKEAQQEMRYGDMPMPPLERRSESVIVSIQREIDDIAKLLDGAFAVRPRSHVVGMLMAKPIPIPPRTGFEMVCEFDSEEFVAGLNEAGGHKYLNAVLSGIHTRDVQ